MDASNTEAETRLNRADRLVNWRTGVLLAACVAGGLTLTTMVIGAAPKPAASAAAAALAAPTDVMTPDATAISTPALTSVAEPAVEDTAAPALADASTAEQVVVQPPAPIPTPAAASALAPVATVKPVAAPSNVVTAQPAPAPAAAPAAAPVAATPAPAATRDNDAVVTVAPAPVTTAATTTTPPPPPTAASAVVTSPSYTVKSAGSVTLRFDGTSISVASVAAQPNWVYQIDVNGPRSVEVKFFNVSTSAEAEFHAQVESGRIKLG